MNIKKKTTTKQEFIKAHKTIATEGNVVLHFWNQFRLKTSDNYVFTASIIQLSHRKSARYGFDVSIRYQKKLK